MNPVVLWGSIWIVYRILNTIYDNSIRIINIQRDYDSGLQGTMRLNTTNMEDIEYLRSLMIKTAEERGSLAHPDVLKISQQLDAMLNEIQLKRCKRYNHLRRLLSSWWWTNSAHFDESLKKSTRT